MKNNKNKTSKNAKNKQQSQDNAVNSTNNSFDLKKHSLDREAKPEDIGFIIKR